MIHDGPARKHYLSIVEKRGSFKERLDARRPTPRLGFLTYTKLYQQPYAMPSTFVTESEDEGN